MADRAKKVSELTSLTAASGDDLLLIVDDPSGTPATKSITVDALFTGSAINGSFADIAVTDTATIATGNIDTISTITLTSTDTITGDIGNFANVTSTDTITGNNGNFANVASIAIQTNSNFILNNKYTPLSNPTDSSLEKVLGSIFWDENYLYIAFQNNHIKRVALESFFFLSASVFQNTNIFYQAGISLN